MEEQVLLMPLCREPHISHVTDLRQRFLQIVYERRVAAFKPWLAACAASEFAAVRAFAETLVEDRDVVSAAPIEP